MAGDGLITIGGLARACGLTASALRFYDDCGLLKPARVDSVTGYRYYSAAQVDRGVMIQRLRAIGVLVGRDALLTVLEDGCAAPVVFSVDENRLLVHRDGRFGLGSSRHPEKNARLHIPAAITGPDIDIAFSPRTLRPELVSALGPEIMLDITTAAAPVIVRSATDGELTTLIMPTAITDSKEYGA